MWNPVVKLYRYVMLGRFDLRAFGSFLCSFSENSVHLFRLAIERCQFIFEYFVGSSSMYKMQDHNLFVTLLS